jgi:hypothetical protein
MWLGGDSRGTPLAVLFLAQDALVDVEQSLGRAQPQPTVAGGRHRGDPIGVQLVQGSARATDLGAAQAKQPGVAGRPDRPTGRHHEVAPIGLPLVFGPASQVDPPHHPRPRVADPDHRTGHHQLPSQLGPAWSRSATTSRR